MENPTSSIKENINKSIQQSKATASEKVKTELTKVEEVLGEEKENTTDVYLEAKKYLSEKKKGGEESGKKEFEKLEKEAHGKVEEVEDKLKTNGEKKVKEEKLIKNRVYYYALVISMCLT